MKRFMNVRMAICVCAAATLAGAGCRKEDQGVKVKGQVLDNGQPVKFLPSEEMKVGFSQEVHPGQQPIGASGVVKLEDGTFLITAPGGKGVPPGKYRVTVFSQIYGGNDKNRFEALFGPKKPPLIVEVGPEAGQTFLIDVAKGTVTKQ